MCGIFGAVQQSPCFAWMDQALKALSHRGPDHAALWQHPETKVALGHRRLAILDLSPRGEQPMFDRSGRYLIVYNGEVYNFPTLQQELSSLGHTFHSDCDTEVILAAFWQWGIPATLEKLVGMFAIGLWDEQEQTLHLIRDRLGIKPLYYGWLGQDFVFTSELTALACHPHFSARVNLSALELFTRYSYIPAPYSIYENLYKLLPGYHLKFSLAQNPPSVTQYPYWSISQVIPASPAQVASLSWPQAKEQLQQLLRQVVTDRLIADVPVGAFLSGGIDSSLVTALMQEAHTQKAQTFTVGFSLSQYDESKFAKEVAQVLGTDHHELFLDPKQILAEIPQIIQAYDEPFADSSQIPTYYISRLAKRQITVALSGDGGDELFGGYNRHLWAPRIEQKMALLPLALRRQLARLMRQQPLLWQKILSFLAFSYPTGNLASKIQKLAQILASSSREEIYQSLLSHWQQSPLISHSSGGHLLTLDVGPAGGNLSFAEQIMLWDTQHYLPDDILTKVDRASMAHSLEVRVPLLDHRLLAFAWQLPLEYKIRGGVSKWALRQILKEYLPAKLIQRPKMGFAIPISQWLRGPLKKWAQSLLHSQKIKQEGFFQSIEVERKWQEHQSGKRDWHSQLWNVLVFQAWKETHQIK